MSKIKMKDGGLTQGKLQSDKTKPTTTSPQLILHHQPRQANERRAIKTTVSTEQEWRRRLDKTESVRDDELGEDLETFHHNSCAFVTWSIHSQALNP